MAAVMSCETAQNIRFVRPRKQSTIHDATTGFPVKWHLREQAQKFDTDDASLPRSG